MAVSFSQFASLASGAGTTIEFKSEYGYVIIVGVASGFLLTWQAIQVGKMRKKFRIFYPIMYSQETSGDGHLFNCYQRAHQNTLESYPLFLMLLFTGGVEHPLPSAVGGAVWILGKIFYSLGYYTGDPKKRVRGGFSNLALLTLTGSSIALATRMLGWRQGC